MFLNCGVFLQFEIFTGKPHWTLSLLANLVGYSAVFLPGIAVVYYVESCNYLSYGGGCLAPLIKRCFYGTAPDISDSISASVDGQKKVSSTYSRHL